MDERKTKELKLIENKIRMEIAQQTQQRKENEDLINSVLDEKIYGIRLELTKEKKVREEMEEELNHQITENIAKLNEVVDNEVINREEAGNAALAKI
jgi:hypothetical protein